MGSDLKQIAEKLKDAVHKVDKQEERSYSLKAQLIYAFNGTGKTRLSKEFKELIAPKIEDSEEGEALTKIIYYNAFTEDLFYWDNDLKNDDKIKLKIHNNAFTKWVLKTQGNANNIIKNFQRYINDDKLTPQFNEEYTIRDENDKEVIIPAYSEVTFSYERGDNTSSKNIKISKGEESIFIWSIFYSFIKQIILELNISEVSERSTNDFDNMEYIFIDDPVSSLDENHLIDLAIDLSTLIKDDTSNIKFIITTHNPLFYNVLHHELDGKEYKKYILNRLEDRSYILKKQQNDSPFAYHHYLIKEIEKAIETKDIRKYHFNYVRNILEKTATFFGKNGWGKLLPMDPDNNDENVYARVINLYSHSKLSNDEIIDVEERHKPTLKFLLSHIKKLYEPDLTDSSSKKDS
ncbi:AAA family ATPase [Sulfurimonas sp.]|uniref:AAA family ATPase n=1 Tax=Sulfurimonas sp. TaxID=2022749 RepID=UPI00260E3081|nr:AAA family ATPase [Sulfurimonas sp.]MDD5156834.1 AAA family ATPase [Sulfurimonas sp.]